MQNRAQKEMLDARDREIYKYRSEHPAESFQTIAGKKLFHDLKGNPITAQRLHMVFVRLDKGGVDKSVIDTNSGSAIIN